MTRLNVPNSPATKWNLLSQSWLIALVLGACSLKSLDHLQGGELSDDGGAGHPAKGGSSDASGGQNVAGTSFPAQGATANAGAGANRAGNGGSAASPGGTQQAGAGATLGSSGGTTSTAGGTNLAGRGGSTAGTSGATSAATTGGTNQTGGGSSHGGTNPAGGTSTGGGTNPAGGTSTGGTNPTGGASTAGGAGGASISGSSSVSGSSGNAGRGGAAGTGGTSTTTIPPVPGQSCSRAGGLNCPTGETVNVSCCEQLMVPTEGFRMGDNGSGADQSPEHWATVSPFLMDKFEVTVGRFRSFFEVYDGTLPPEGAGALPDQPNSGWLIDFRARMPLSKEALSAAINCGLSGYQTWSENAGTNDTLPMNCVSWYVALAFCIWDGGRLPTEAEWEMVATNAWDNQPYPWGATEPDPKVHAVMDCKGDGVDGCSPKDILPVGSRPAGASRWGHLDLAGSSWEWVLDYYDAKYYTNFPDETKTCNNCINLSAQTKRVTRGGDFVSSSADNLRASARAANDPVKRDYTGFRCVRSAPPP